MAGIGFSLKQLFSKKGFFSLCRAYGYAGIICAGPMVLGVIMLAGIALIADIAGMDSHDRELMNCMLTYSLLASLTLTSWFNMVTTRFVSDMLYEEKTDRIMPSFYGSCAILLVADLLLYGVFLFFSGVKPVYQLLCLWFSLILIVVWMETVYLTALKDYRAIVVAFCISLMTGFLLALILVILGWVSIVSLMLCMIVAYGMLMAWYYKLLLDYFPKSAGSKYSFLRWMDKYHSLALIGGTLNLGLFAHLVIMYFGPLQVQVEGLFYGAPLHDVPALFAFFSILITTITFVTSVEVRFYVKYRNYYSLFNDNGSINDIEQAEQEMLSVLRQELTLSGHKQLISTILFIIFGSYILEWMPVGFTDMSLGIYRFLCAGYGVYAVSNSIMLILLYFEDYAGALMGTVAFAVVSISATILQILYGSPVYFGLGFLAGGVVFYLIVWLRLEWYTKRLPYFLLCRQEVVAGVEKGLFVKLCDYLDGRAEKRSERVDRKRWNKTEKKRRRRKSGVTTTLLLVLALAFSGCAAEAVPVESEAPPREGAAVEKAAPAEDGHLRDNMALYAGDDETSVVTMYLTVRQGNAEDNTDHTWAEINTYSVYDYEKMGEERYNVEGILQIGDENGPVEGEFGCGETVPNVAVQIRGQTSSRAGQKNYKIRIKDGMGEWRGQQTLALNKHIYDVSRFRNKLAYDLMKDIPQMMSARTQFVHLYVKDETEGAGGGYVDYGLYTMVEQMNKAYLENHGLDDRGHLYKINFFEWNRYEDVLKLKTDEGYDLKAFEEYLEVKGSDDHTKLLTLLDKINDYSIPIEEIVAQHFDMENLCYWMAFHTLIGNYDVASRNYFIYSPLNSDKWYFISWDNDASFSRAYFRSSGYSEGLSWNNGITLFTASRLFHRILQAEEYRQMLDAAILDLKDNYMAPAQLRERVAAYAAVVEPFVSREPDREGLSLRTMTYAELIEKMPAEIEENYQYYLESLREPWPFYVNVLSEGETLRVTWDASHDIGGLDVEYSLIIAKDYDFQQVVARQEGIRIPGFTMELPEPGRYFVRVRARNEAGYEQDCFDYYVGDEVQGKIYGAHGFFVLEDGSIEVITATK